MTDITIPAKGGGIFSAYLAAPVSHAGAGVLVVQEIFGVNKVMRDICDALAAQGYFALCPDLFWRQEAGLQLTDQNEQEQQHAIELYQAFDETYGVEDLVASLGVLRQVDGCSGRVGTVGFCLGGKLAYLMATRSNADCNVCYYGVGSESGIDSELDEAGSISKPLMLHIAEQDAFCSKEAQQKIKDVLGGNSLVTIHSYAGMDHAFARVGGAHYNGEAADLASKRSHDFFAEHLRD